MMIIPGWRRIRNFQKALLVFLIAIGLAVLFTSPAFAQDSSAEDQRTVQVVERMPKLGNHNFLPNTFIRGPFINTYIRNTLGIGKAVDLDIPLLNVDGEEVIGLKGDLLFAALEFEYQHAVKDWLAVALEFEVIARLGTGVGSLLAQGITATNGLELSWMMKLLRTERVMLSASLNIWNNSGTIIDIQQFVDRAIEEGEIAPDNELVKSRPFLRGGGAVSMAWAISEVLGLNALTQLSYGEAIDRRQENKFYYKVGVSLDYDLAKRTIFPLGLGLGYGFNTFRNEAGSNGSFSDRAESLYFRIAYTTPVNFLLSLDTTWNRIPLRNEDKNINAGVTVINMRYYF